jgi:hypothetical protein
MEVLRRLRQHAAIGADPREVAKGERRLGMEVERRGEALDESGLTQVVVIDHRHVLAAPRGDGRQPVGAPAAVVGWRRYRMPGRPDWASRTAAAVGSAEP